MLKTVEGVIQFEHDKFLRRLNDSQIADQPTRKILINARGAGYDYFNDNYKSIQEKANHDDIKNSSKPQPSTQQLVSCS